MAEPLALKDHNWEARIFFNRMVLGFGLLILLTLLLFLRFFYLQIIEYDVHATLSDKNRIQVQPLAPVRGLIYDRHGELLAANAPSFNLEITPERVDDIAATLSHLRKALKFDNEVIEDFEKRMERRRRPFEPVPLLYRLSQEEIAVFSVDRHLLPGVEVKAHLVRHYPQAEDMVHAVGSVRRINEQDAREVDSVAYAGTDHIGKIGVERFYEADLLGRVGYQQVEIDARGRIMKVLESQLPTPGKDLTLHIDSSLQRAAVLALGERRGSVVAIEPETGGVLAMVSKPSYDPNLFVTGIGFEAYASLRDSIDTPLFNRAVQGQYQPGSTIKPIIGLAALASGYTTPEFKMSDPGWYRLPGNERLYRDWNWRTTTDGGHGIVDLRKAIYQSCNIYFYSLAVKMGIDLIDDYLALFGFGSNAILDFPEASSGLLPTRQWKRKNRGLPWYPGDTLNLGIGQGDMLVTPLQLATATSVIANRGKWIAPRMLKSGGGLPAESAVPGMENIDIPPAHIWEYVIESMEMVVHRGNQGFGENGTAWAYIGQDISYRMAGKSGTAQVVEIKQGEEYDDELLDERQRKHAWFVAFAPVESPKIAIAVLLENGGGGSEFAAPVARDIVDHYLLGLAESRLSSLSGASQ